MDAKYVDEFLRRSIDACPRAGVNPEAVVRSKLRTRLLVLERVGRDAAVRVPRDVKSSRAPKTKRRRLAVPAALRHRRSSRVRPGRGAAPLPFTEPLSSKQRRFSRYAPLHELWKRSTFGALATAAKVSEQQVRSALRTSPDLTGAFLLIKRSVQPALVGCRGIVVQELATALRLVTPRNELRTVAKCGSTFVFTFGGVKVALKGDDLVESLVHASRKGKQRARSSG